MALDYDKLMAMGWTDVPFSYSDRETLLYALSVGFGSNPKDVKELPYVVETLGQHTVPTMAATITYPDFMIDCG